MSGPWKPTIFEGQNLAAEEASSSNISPASRYQPIAPHGGVPYNSSASQRRRIERACDECRRKKIKCYTTEGSASCKNCISYQKGCTYNTSIKKRGPPRGYIGVLENRLKRIEGLIDTMSGKVDHDRNPSTATNSSVSPMAEHNSSSEDDETKRNEDAGGKIIPGAKVMFDAIRDTHLTSEGRFVSGNSIFSRKMKLLDQTQLNRYDVDIQNNENSDYFYIKKKDTLDDRRRDQILQLIDFGIIKKTEVINNIDDWIWKVAGIDKELSDRLLKVYFAYIHPLLPVINKVAFLQEYRGIRSSFPSGALLNAVYGASVRYIENCKRFGVSDRLDEGKPWEFSENLSKILFQNLLLFIKGKYVPSLSTIQAIVIAHNHSATVRSWTVGWLLNCIAVRMSQDIGLNRSSDGWNISQQEKETRRMVWWQVYLLDRWFSAGTGRPLTAFDEDCDELYPSENVSLDEIMDTTTETDKHLPRFPSLDKRVAAKATGSSIPMNQPFLHLLKLSEILGRILQGLYTPKAKKHSEKHGSDAIIGYLDDALSNWRSSLPPLLEISSAGKRSLGSEEDYVPLLSMSSLICLSYYALLILLHRPFIEKDDTKDTDANTNNSKPKLSSQSALTICTGAAIRIIEVSESMHCRDFLLVSWGFALYPVFTAALIHIYNSSDPDSIVSDVARSNLVRALAVIDKLCLLSPMATSMGDILRKVIALSPIFVDDPDFVSIVSTRKDSEGGPSNKDNASSTTKLAGKEQVKVETVIDNHDVPLNKNNVNNTESIEKEPGTRKVGKKYHGWTPADESTLRNHRSPNEHIDKKRALDISTPAWDDIGDWLNQLYTPTQASFDLKDDANSKSTNNVTSSLNINASEPLLSVNYTTQQVYQKQFDEQTSNVDVYSIRQFGFNMMNNNNNNFTLQPDQNLNSFDSNNTQQQRSSNNNSPLSHQQQPAFQQERIVPSMSASHPPNASSSNISAPLSSPAALFDFSDFPYPFLYGTLVLNDMNAMPSTTPNNNNGFTYNTATTPNVNNNNAAAATGNDPSTFFRHRSNNPFWDVPSSMEADDWHAYLLLHSKKVETNKMRD